MKTPEIVVLILAGLFIVFGVVVTATALLDPSWGRAGDVANPYAALMFMLGAASIVAGAIALVVTLVRKR